MASTIRIGAVAGNAPQGCLNLRFTNPGLQKSSVLAIPLPNSFIAEEIRWYLEDFAQHSPSEAERARDARAAMTQLANKLAFYINQSNVLVFESDKQHSLTVEIEDSPDMPPSFLWEALELEGGRRALANVEAILVTRVWTGTGPYIDPAPLNLLIVSARLSFESKREEDIPHRLVSAEVFQCLDFAHGLDSGRLKPFLSVEALHPGTFETLQALLESHPPAYFSHIHLDLHGDNGDEDETDNTGGYVLFECSLTRIGVGHTDLTDI